MGLSKLNIDYLREEHNGTTTGPITAHIDRRIINGVKKLRVKYRRGAEKTVIANPDANRAIQHLSYDELTDDIRSWEESFGADPFSPVTPRRAPVKLFKRAPQTKFTKIEDRTYFKPAHQNNPLIKVVHAWLWRDGKAVNVLYRIAKDKKTHKASRNETKWLDELYTHDIKDEVDNWVKRENNWDPTLRSEFSALYQTHRKRFIKWASGEGSAQSSTLENYESHLRDYVFPYFNGKYRLPEAKWPAAYVKWGEWLSTKIHTGIYRNQVRTSMRRWLKYGNETGLWQVTTPTNERTKFKSAPPIPGDRLPSHDEMLAVVKSLPPSKARFMLTISLAFGTRVSESAVMTPRNFISKAGLSRNSSNSTFTKKYFETYKDSASPAWLFLSVNERYNKGNKELEVLAGIEDRTDPKSGNYEAVCTHKQTALFLQEICKAKEYDLPLPANFYAVFDSLDSEFKEWRWHHFRKWHETWLALDWSPEISANCHGHSMLVSTRHYVQWAMTRISGGLHGDDHDNFELLGDDEAKADTLVKKRRAIHSYRRNAHSKKVLKSSA